MDWRWEKEALGATRRLPRASAEGRKQATSMAKEMGREGRKRGKVRREDF
jgi:hypothetical protein